MDLKDTLQFGPHKVEVTAIHERSDMERLLTVKCVDRCCSENKVQITMLEGELKALANLYTGQVTTVQMKQNIEKMLAELRQHQLPPSKPSIEEEIRNPLNNREFMVRRHQANAVKYDNYDD